MKAGLIVLFLVCVGIGQGIAVTLLFGRHDDRLTVEAPAGESSSHAPAEAGAHAAPPAAAPPAPAAPVPAKPRVVVPELDISEPPPRRDLHVLEIARERFELGDVEGARQIASSYLLRLDGLSHVDALRAPEAYAILADVLRRDFERSLGQGGIH